MRRALLLLVLGTWLWTGPADAQVQLRTLPVNARGAILGQPLPLPYVKLNRKVFRLTPGAVIYDQNDRFILQNALPAGARIAFTADASGEITHIYILTAQEQTQFKFK